MRARTAVTGSATGGAEGATEWEFIQKHKPYASDLLLSEERVRYMQEINLGLGLQKRMLPYEQVADMTLAQDALKLMAQTRRAGKGGPAVSFDPQRRSAVPSTSA